jgi:hypothetical protein
MKPEEPELPGEVDRRRVYHEARGKVPLPLARLDRILGGEK